MMNRSMISYIEIIKLQSLNTLTIENLYQILSKDEIWQIQKSRQHNVQ